VKNYILLFSIILFASTSALSQYCTANGNTSTYEWIERVSFGFDKKQTGNNGGYLDDVLGVPMHASQGMCFYLNMEPGYSGYAYNEYWGVWIDFNNDGDFTDDGEEVFLSTAPTNYGAEAQLSIPIDAPVGFTQMRVIMKYGSQPNPCGDFVFGEVEDYTFYVEDGLYSCENGTGSTTYEWIDGIGVGDLFLFNGNNDGFHADYCQLYHVDLSDSLTVAVEPGYSSYNYGEYVSISFDKNNDNDFRDPGETWVLDEINEFVSFTQAMDSSIEPDVCHRLRVQLTYYDHAMCEYVTYGEVEEYAVFVTDFDGIHTLSESVVSTRRKHNDGDPRQEKQETIKVYPNPASNFASIDFGDSDKPAEIALLDTNGKVVLNQSRNRKDKNVQLDLAQVSSGFYFVQIKYDNGMETYPLSVQAY